MTNSPQRHDAIYPKSRLKGLKAHTSTQKQATIERLRTAIESLKAIDKPITVHTIHEVSGLDYTSYARNAEALALFRANSTHLAKGRKRQRKKTQIPPVPAPRDPLLNYKKTQLVDRIRKAEHRTKELEDHNSQLVQQQVENDLKYAHLQAEVEEYRTFLQRFRADIQSKEHSK